MYFNKLVELKSYTTVSEYFGVSQPTISMAIQRLEKEFNVELINRNQAHRKIKISPHGKVLYKHTDIINRAVEEIKKDMHHNFKVPIRFGLPPIIGNYYFPILALELSKSDILDDLDNIEAGSGKLLDQLRSGEIDIALLGSNEPIESHAIKSKVLTKSDFKIIVSLNSPLAKLKKIKIKDLNNINFISLSNDFIHHNTFNKLCNEHSIKVHIRYRTQDVELLKQLVSEDLGVSFLTEQAISPKDNLVAIPIDDDDLDKFYVSLTYRKTHVLSPKEKQLIAVLINSIKK
ncbi:LysR family transcriptional regulator [Fructilactobacillus sanfranciscensis]|uniref:LysR family transcriptional regulator n=1 Tax=Fructilactobacillus sanfranciscensis TaxID=1625 RepID=UPI001CDA86FD|nr:LysR family transcriptional regulator [Fructilactobacillus sanfranciscensis]